MTDTNTIQRAVAYIATAVSTEPLNIAGAAHLYIYDETGGKKRYPIGENHYATTSGYLSKRDYKGATDVKEDKTPGKRSVRSHLSMDTQPELVNPIKYLDILYSDPASPSAIEMSVRLICLVIETLLEHNTKNLTLVLTNATLHSHLNALADWEKRGWRTANNGSIPYVKLWRRLAELLAQLTDGVAYYFVPLPANIIAPMDEEEDEEVPVEDEDDEDDVKEKAEPVSSFFGELHCEHLARIASEYAKQLDTGGTMCDKLSLGANQYWVAEWEKPGIMGCTHMYMAPEHQPGRYLLTTPGGKIAFIGRRLVSAQYAVVYDNGVADRGEHPYIKSLLEVFAAHTEEPRIGANHFVLALDTAFSFYFQVLYRHYHRRALVPSRRGDLGLNTPAMEPVIQHINPPALAYRASGILSLLDSYLSEPGINVSKEDVTDYLYEIVEDKKGNPVHQLKPEHTTNANDVKVTLRGIPGYEVTFPLVFGLDILSRNKLKRLEKLKPVANVIYWMNSETSFTLGTTIECEGWKGIYINYYSSTVYLPPKK